MKKRADRSVLRVGGGSDYPDIKSLASRIDAVFSAVAEKTKEFQVEQAETHKQREKRLEELG